MDFLNIFAEIQYYKYCTQHISLYYIFQKRFIIILYKNNLCDGTVFLSHPCKIEY